MAVPADATGRCLLPCFLPSCLPRALPVMLPTCPASMCDPAHHASGRPALAHAPTLSVPPAIHLTVHSPDFIPPLPPVYAVLPACSLGHAVFCLQRPRLLLGGHRIHQLFHQVLSQHRAGRQAGGAGWQGRLQGRAGREGAGVSTAAAPPSCCCAGLSTSWAATRGPTPPSPASGPL